MAARLGSLDYHSYVLLGDGECQEGQVWEAAMAAAHWGADHLHAIVDHNKYQQTGPISREMSLAPFAEKWAAFGWHVQECDGHDLPALIAALTTMRQVTGRPSVLIAHTVKGKGVSFIERDYTMHGRSLSPAQDAQAREEIRCL
jgi:transketolase